MTLRRGHGKGAGVPRVEVLPVDELPAGVPAVARAESPRDRGEAGRFAPGNALARAGGHARAGKTRLADRLGLVELPAGCAFAPYRASAVSFRRAQCAALAQGVGGGVCGAAPSSLVATAALQLAWSRFFSDKAAVTGDADLALTASRLGDASRQSLLAAHELCAKEAQARRQRAEAPPPWLEAPPDAPKGGT
ncbi:MAG: hypothetical protein ACLQVI_33575 [Polyangiaceae bacterium]